ncbi:hypothetical protein RB195_000720 [Necator americanus]|uniref:Uncharacterized protein n=1 Tax=Necator americanus TaxID=51031 RepID=A0ABR1DB19_NECAM
MAALRTPDGTTTASRRGVEKVIHNFYSDLFDSIFHLPPYHLREDGHVIPNVFPSEVGHVIMSVKNRTLPGPDRIKPEHLKYLLPVVINTLVQEGHVGQRLCMESFMRRLGPESDIMSNVRFDRLSPFAVLSYVWEVASDSENSECRSYQSCLFAYVARGRNSAVRHPVTFTPLRGGKPLWRGLE